MTRSLGVVAASAGAMIAAVVLLVAGVASGTSQPPAYCPLPAGPAHPAWAFHAGAQIVKPRGTYAHGNGTLTGTRVGGRICQVDRTPGSPDRQVILAVTGGDVVPVHGAIVGGVPGNRMLLPVRVAGSTDARCRVGTKGTVMLFASYNGVRKDVVQLSFPRACRDHDHDYTGPSVVALVPR